MANPGKSNGSALLNLLTNALRPDDKRIAHTPISHMKLLTRRATLPSPCSHNPTHATLSTCASLINVRHTTQIPLKAFKLITNQSRGQYIRRLDINRRHHLTLTMLLTSPPRVLLLSRPAGRFSLDLIATLRCTLTRCPNAITITSRSQ